MKRFFVGVALLCCLGMAACSSSDDAEPSEPETTATSLPPADVTVSGPIEGGTYGVPYNPTPTAMLEEAGYSEEEFFVSGTADSFTSSGPLSTDGVWSTTPGPTATYTTRIIVRRPEDPEKFNGKVLVEWFNVSAGRDSDPDWGFLHSYLTREGRAYVGVSAQQVGVEGGPTRLEVPGVPAVALAPLKQWDPERYADLEHPGDAWSYGIYSDVARLIRAPGDPNPLGGLTPETVIAIGESQSAGRMATYVNGVHPVDKLFDGFLVHSRGRSAPALNDTEAGKVPNGTHIRTDLDQPVLQFETETDLIRLGFLDARQPDTDSVRTWEVAGTAHADQSTLDYGAASGGVWLPGERANPAAECGAINHGPQREVLRAALESLSTWIADGTTPPMSPLLETAEGQIVTGPDGNALGGVRTPPVDAPVSALSGQSSAASVFCSLFGQRRDYTPAELTALYPDNAAYVAAVRTSADGAARSGFLLEPERNEFVKDAEAADVP